ncbi:LytR C-terminal domain-containing protein [Patescibacteria group bacterium]
MPDKKKKEKPEEKTPTIVEVYGDDMKDVKPKKEEGTGKEKKGELKKTEEVVEEKEKESEEIAEKKEKEEVDEMGSMKVEVLDEKNIEEEKKNKEDEEAFEEEIGHQKKATRSIFGVGIIIFLTIFGLTGWAFYLKTLWMPGEIVTEVLMEEKNESESVATPTPAPTPEPLSREEIKLEILNGSGVTGLAGKNKTIFEDLGYVVESVGNADSVKETELYIKEDLEEKLEYLLIDFKDTFGEASVSGYLDDDSEVAAQIILGE